MALGSKKRTSGSLVSFPAGTPPCQQVMCSHLAALRDQAWPPTHPVAALQAVLCGLPPPFLVHAPSVPLSAFSVAFQAFFCPFSR